jgi:hypothetical protein
MSEFIGTFAFGVMSVVGGILSVIAVRNTHSFFWENYRVYWQSQFWGDEAI